MSPGAAFWKDRRVLLTGHTGFKGGWMSLWLRRLGARVTGYALAPSTTPSLFDLAGVSRDMESILGDIRDDAALRRAVAHARPEIVIHMAAQPLVRRSYADPVETYATNVSGLVNLFEAVRATPGVRAVLNVTSDKCYAQRGAAHAFAEDDPLGGHDPYSASKACAEIVGASYRDAFFAPADYARHGVAVASARAGNVIGGGDWAVDRLVADMARAFEAKVPVRIRNPGAVRPWQHVLEPLSGYLLLAERLCTEGPAWGEAWNFGPDPSDERPVSWVADELAKRWGQGAAWVRDGDAHPHEAPVLRLDTRKARGRLGWRPRLALADALDLTVAWHRARMSGADARDTTLAQIDAYSQAPRPATQPNTSPA